MLFNGTQIWFAIQVKAVKVQISPQATSGLMNTVEQNHGQDNAVRRDLVILDVPWLINGVWVMVIGHGYKSLTGVTHWFETEMSKDFFFTVFLI